MVRFRRARAGARTGALVSWEAPEYLALIVGPWGEAHAVPLGPAAPIDDAARRLRDALAVADADVQSVARQAYDVILAPLQQQVPSDPNFFDEGSARVYLSLDGELHTIPFGALFDGSRYLIESYRFTYRDALHFFGPGAGEVSPTVHLFADPDLSHTFPRGRFAGHDVGELAALPGAREEASQIARKFLRADLRLGADATKSALLALPSPGVLVVSTHGFFFEDSNAPALDSRALGLVEAPPEDTAVLRRNPLFRSGLALAGGESSDGVATAFEIASANLSGTQLVVLDACETGRGEMHIGQGIFGMRRALSLAGARTTVLGLWQVDDEITGSLMVLFFDALGRGERADDAMREASLRTMSEHPHPNAWAPFVVAGDGGPLVGVEFAARQLHRDRVIHP